MLDDLLHDALMRLDPEDAHHRALQLLTAGGAVGRAALRARYGPSRQRPVSLWGLTFPNAVGLAAGYDKDGSAWRALAALGFGHVEVGTVTPRPQPGNPRPRIFRLPEQHSLINRMGFPSAGAAAVRARLGVGRPFGVVLGVNLGKNKDTPNEEAARDYVAGVEVFADVADYLVVNVSSPNTPGLRDLQRREPLAALLRAVVAARPAGKPVLVKLAPDLDDDALDDAIGAVVDAGIDGVIASNTTLARDGVSGPVAAEAGGLSGRALRDKALATLLRVRARVGLPVVAAGGVASVEDAQARLDAGAALVQVYTGLVYEGPAMVRRLVEGIA